MRAKAFLYSTVLGCGVFVASGVSAAEPVAAGQESTKPRSQRPAKPTESATSAETRLEAPMPQTASDQSVSPVASVSDDQKPDNEAGDIVVTGIRRSLESAQLIKKESDGIVDAIVAEDIGKLPDTFASSALARVSGIQVTRGGGEAANVRIRGLPDTATTYNGREIFSAELRSANIQDFPAGTVAALEVYKSGVANMLEAGIAGLINVRSRRPFDFKGFQISGGLNGVSWEQADKTTWNGNLLVSNRWDTGIGEMGLLVNVAYIGINYLDATREQSLVLGTTTAANAPGQPLGVRYPDGQSLFHERGRRWRPSANFAYQWRPSPELEIYADGLFQGYRGRDGARFFNFSAGGTGAQISNLVLREGTTNVAQSMTVTGGSVPSGNYRSGTAKTDTYQFGGGAIWKRDRLRLTADVAYTDSNFSIFNTNIDFSLTSAPRRDYVFEAPGGVGGPVINFGNYNLGDPANYISNGLFQEYLAVGGKGIQGRFDAQYDMPEGGVLQRIQVGFRYSGRDAYRDRGTSFVSNTAARIPISQLPVTIEPSSPAFGFDNVYPIRTFATISAESIRDNIVELRKFFGRPEGLPPFDPIENFQASEKTYTVYGQLKSRFEVGNLFEIEGLAGLRVVRTKTTVSGFTRVQAASAVFTPTTAVKEYNDYLPNVSARVMFSKELQLRLAFTKTRTRPGFLDLNPGLVVGAIPVNQGPNSPRAISGGNPDLVPLTSNNYDASLEWYFSRTGSLTGGVFRRDTNGFIQRPSTVVNDPVYGWSRFTLPVNLGQTQIQGAEVAFSSFLDVSGLPSWAKGFGLQANATYIDANSVITGPNGLSPNVAGREVPFAGVSKWSFNLIGIYERKFFAARLAYNYRSDFVTGYSRENGDLDVNLQPRTGGLIERARGQADFSMSVTPTPQVTIAFDISNLLGNPIKRYRSYTDAEIEYARQFRYNDRLYSLGVRFRF